MRARPYNNQKKNKKKPSSPCRSPDNQHHHSPAVLLHRRLPIDLDTVTRFSFVSKILLILRIDLWLRYFKIRIRVPRFLNFRSVGILECASWNGGSQASFDPFCVSPNL